MYIHLSILPQYTLVYLNVYYQAYLQICKVHVHFSCISSVNSLVYLSILHIPPMWNADDCIRLRVMAVSGQSSRRGGAYRLAQPTVTFGDWLGLHVNMNILVCELIKL